MMFSNSAFSLGFAFHWVFMFVTLLGLVAGVVWMARFATKKQLKVWFWVGLILGLLGSWITFGSAFEGMRGMMSEWREFDSEDEDGDIDDRIESMEEWRDEMMDLDDEEDEEVTEGTTTTK